MRALLSASAFKPFTERATDDWQLGEVLRNDEPHGVVGITWPERLLSRRGKTRVEIETRPLVKGEM